MASRAPFHLRSLGALVVVVGLTAGSAHADSLEQMFLRANDALYAGDSARARDGYEALVEAGVDDADVYWNLGLAHARLGARGKAIHAFERALRVNPRMGDAVAGIAALRHELAEQEGEEVPNPSTEWSSTAWRELLRPIPERAAAMGLLVVNALFFAALALRLRVREAGWRTAFGITAPTLAVIAVLLALVVATQRGAFDTGIPCIVVAPNEVAREGPSHDARTVTPLEEGREIRCFEAWGPFREVRTGSGESGWIPAASVGTF